MTRVIDFSAEQKINISNEKRNIIFDVIEKRWCGSFVQQTTLHDGFQAMFTLEGDMYMIQIGACGISTETKNIVTRFPSSREYKVMINTSNPSPLLQLVWNVLVTYELLPPSHKNHQSTLKITIRKKVTSSSLLNILLTSLEHNHRMDTQILADMEAQTISKLLQ